MRLKNIFFLLFVSIFLNAAEADFADPNICAGCHTDVYDDWAKSLHAFSHEHSNELFKNAISLVSNKTGNLKESVAISCGQCHNAKLQIKELDASMSVALSLDLDEKNMVEQLTKSDEVKNGISCYICHNVDKIKQSNDNSMAGYKSFDWSTEYITGPYDVNNDEALYHQSQKREFFQQNDELCNSCHQGFGNKNKLSLYNTQNEGDNTPKDKLCVDCHMGTASQKIIAPGAPRDNAIERNIRSHFFSGARNSNILKEAIKLDLNRTSQSNAILNVKNLTKHKVPTGFSGRSIEIYAKYRDQTGKILKDGKLTSFRAIYTDNIGNETLSYTASQLKDDTRLNAGEIRPIELNIPQNTYTIEIRVLYYVLAPELKNLLNVKNTDFTKPYEVIDEIF